MRVAVHLLRRQKSAETLKNNTKNIPVEESANLILKQYKIRLN